MFKRYNGNVVPFASNSTSDNRTVFGDTTQSDDIDDNLNDDFKLGWEIVGANDNPTKQDFNALAFTVSNLVSYLYQQGISEWNTHQDYLENSYTVSSDGEIYKSVSGTESEPNQGNDPTTDDGTNWVILGGGDADTLDGKDSTDFALMNDFDNDLSENGYQKLPNGLIIQWGQFTLSGGDAETFNYNISFPNACLSLIGCDYNDASITDETARALLVHIIDESEFEAKLQDNSEDNKFGWVAIGY